MKTKPEFVIMCAWHEKPKSDALIALGVEVSHTICASCKTKLLANLKPK